MNSLPENNISVDLLTLETEMLSQDSVMPDVGPPTTSKYYVVSCFSYVMEKLLVSDNISITLIVSCFSLNLFNKLLLQ